MTVQPTATGTRARFVHTTVDPPSLVIDDGTTTLVLRPAEGTDGVAAAAELAQELVQVASEWESGCRRTLAAIQPEDRFDSDAPATDHGDDEPDLNKPHARPRPTMSDGRTARGSAPKPVRRTGLIAARKAAGFTQETLAARLGVERSTVYRWESSETTPLPMLRLGLAQLLRVDNDRLSALLGEPVDQAAPTAAEPDPTPAALLAGSLPHAATSGPRQ